LRSYVFGAFSKPPAVLPRMPSAVAVTWPVYRPWASFAGSTPTGTVAVPLAGTVTVPSPGTAAANEEATFNFTAVSVVLVYVTSLVTTSASGAVLPLL